MSDFKLIPSEPPKSNRGRKANPLYRDILTKFVAGKDDSVQVEVTGLKPATIAQGLKGVIKTDGLPVKVTVLKEGIWLVKVKD